MMMKEEKKSHGVQLLVRAVVKDPEGKVLSDTGRNPAKSFVIQFLEAISAVFEAKNNYDVTKTNGAEGYLVENNTRTNYNYINILAGVNLGSWGIVIGAGTTAPTNTDHNLETKIAHGAGAGQMTHGASSHVATAVVGANVDLETKRPFTNNSGSSITVNEVGIYCYNFQNTLYHMLIRDVLITGVAVPDKCSLTIYYTWRTTV